MMEGLTYKARMLVMLGMLIEMQGDKTEIQLLLHEIGWFSRWKQMIRILNELHDAI
ncbi:hypothetical protein Tco_0383939, partial [Tanacetum coccineum]